MTYHRRPSITTPIRPLGDHLRPTSAFELQDIREHIVYARKKKRKVEAEELGKGNARRADVREQMSPVRPSRRGENTEMTGKY